MFSWRLRGNHFTAALKGRTAINCPPAKKAKAAPLATGRIDSVYGFGTRTGRRLGPVKEADLSRTQGATLSLLRDDLIGLAESRFARAGYPCLSLRLGLSAARTVRR